MLAINMEPVYGILLGVLIFGSDEKMSLTFYIGALLILLSVLTNGFLKLKENEFIHQLNQNIIFV